MKYATILAILSFAAGQASAHQYPANVTTAYTDGEWEQIFKGGLGHCGAPGKPCHNAKRAALAVAEAISFPDPKGRMGFCSVKGMPCMETRNAEPEPRKHKHKHKHPKVGFCSVLGMPCMENGKRSALPEADADADPVAMAGGHVGLCSVKGMPCMAAREALEKIGRVAEKTHHTIWAREAEAEAAAEATPKRKNGFCSIKGMACMEARNAEPDPKKHKHKHPKVGFCSVLGMPCMENGKRSALPEAEAVAGKNGRCGVKGMACMAKRDADAAQRHSTHKGEGHKGEGHKGTWCGAGGKDCTARRADLDARLPADRRSEFCGVPGSTCTEERQIDDFEELDLTPEEGETHANYIREIVDGLQSLDPELDKRECYAEHGPCSDVLKAKKAFEAAKAHANKGNHSGFDSETTEIARAHLQVRDLPAAREAEASCYGPDGTCTAAKRAVDELENAINEAVALLN